MSEGAIPTDEGELPPEAELAELLRLTRAHLEWHRITGSLGVPAATAAELAETAAVPAAPQEARAAAAPSAPAAPGAPIPAAPIAVPVDPEARRQRLTVLEGEARACTACALHRERTQAVFARGTGSSGLVFVGEGPGADEDAQGYPFVGAAGQLLDRMIAAMGLGRDDAYVCNIVKCRPPKNRKPEPEEMAACSPFLTEQLELLAPQVIVALGATAVQGLLGTSEGITRMRGKWKLYRGRIAVMPTFHPAYLLRTPEAKREVWQDLQEVLRHMGRAVPAR
jgi:uracil-DNA glycosylase family 4